MNQSTAHVSLDDLIRSLMTGTGSTFSDAFNRFEDKDKNSVLVESPESGQSGAKVKLFEKHCEGYWGLLHLADGLRVVVCDCNFENFSCEIYPGDGWLEFHLKQSGQMSIKPENKTPIFISGPSLLVWYLSGNKIMREWEGIENRERSVSIFCTPEYIQENILAGSTNLPISISGLVAARGNEIKYSNVLLSSILMDLTASFFRIEYLKTLELVYSEAKAREALCLIFHELAHLEKAEPAKYRGTDVNKFQEAYEFLLMHFNPPPTITQLARMIGLNETKLKSGFKDIYGVTIHEFANQKRMEYAMKILQDQRLPVSIAAEMAGYKHQATFTTAFKSYFGIRPSDVKKIIQSNVAEDND